MRPFVLSIFLMVLALSVVACQGPAGPQGPAGEQGPPGATAEPGVVDEAMVASIVERVLSESGAEPSEADLLGKADAPAYTQAFVRQAINLYDSVGLDATVDYYNTPESIDGQWYVFIFDENDTLIAHAADQDLVGRHASDVRGPNDYPTGSAVVASADEDGAWFDYTFPNPATGGVETKHSWMVVHDGITFGSGWYERGPAKSDAPAYTQAFVRQAIKLYDAVGLEDTVAHYNTRDSVDGQWYVFIIDGDGYTIGHFNPEFIGRDPSLRVDATGRFYGDELLGATESGRWVDYVLTNPAAGENRQKHTWIVRHDGLLFASGWYE